MEPDLATNDDDLSLRYSDSQPLTETDVFGPETDHEPVSSRFDATNEQAIPVEQRATTSHRTGSQTIGNGAEVLVGRSRNRKYLVVSCPATTTAGGVGTTPKGFQVSQSRAAVEANIGYQINPGDSLEIDSMGEVWVAPLPGNTTGLVQFSEGFDVMSGPAAR